MKLAVIGDEDTILGFKLAGVKNSTVFSETELENQLDAYKDMDLVIVTETVAMQVRQKKIKVHPVMVEVPDKSGSKGFAFEQISKLFESAIGVKLRSE